MTSSPLRRCVLLLLLITASAFAQDDDEQPPGLHARYQVGQAVVERVDPDIAFVWGDAAPDDRLPSGKFTANWSGTLLLRSQDKYRVHAFVQGRVSVKVNQQVVLDGETDRPGWISGPEKDLTFGDQSFEVSFARTGDVAQLKLYWSSTDFPLEPLPYHVLFQAKPSPDLTLVERGRVQFEAFRCGNCHTEGGDEPSSSATRSFAAPSLKHVGIGSRREWLIEKLMLNGDSKLAGDKPNMAGKMPHFGLDRDEAESIVATLVKSAAPVELTTVGKSKDSEREKDLQAGRTLIRSVGCLACHTWDSLGEHTSFGGGSLNDLAHKRTAGWLTTWLFEPSRLNSQHRMPVFNLTAQERTQIVLSLLESDRSAGNAIPETSNNSDVDAAILARGKKLIDASRCSLCHELPGLNANSSTVFSLAAKETNWSRGCTQSPDRAKYRPGFPQCDMEAIRAYAATWQSHQPSLPVFNPTSPSSLAGRTVLERKNCLGCHDRDATRGIANHAAAVARADEALTSLHMTLIPPRLNAVGDRMHDMGLAEAIRGEQKFVRMNWLRVRMPRFQHSATEQAAIVAHLNGHDRIPDGAPQMEPPGARRIGIAADHSPDPQQRLAGRELLGGKGFSCVACHAVKDYTPKVTALGTRGSNLHLIGQRMRTDYFFRWTRAPLRLMPGVEMPNYQRPHEFILPGQLDQQLIAIWDALNDPLLTAPTNPAIVEQLLAVKEVDDLRVVRDVFTVPGTSDETVARAYAIGFPGGHSVLFDLETCSVKGWTLGDFARQRCEGKRWYWDLAGTVVATGFDKRPEIVLVHKETGEVIAPETGWNVECRLNAERIREKARVALEYDLTFSKDGHSFHLPAVIDEFVQVRSGWERHISATINQAVWPWFRNTPPAVLSAQARISIQGEKADPVRDLPAAAVPFKSIRDGKDALLTVEYGSSLRWSNPMDTPSQPPTSQSDSITTVPGFQGRRLSLPRSIMPTAFAWDTKQRLLFTSLKGHVYKLQPNKDRTTSLTIIEEGLAAPFGVIEDRISSSNGEVPDLLVAHKPELLRLIFTDDGRVADRRVVATGWGITDDYHDWTCGIARDSTGNLFLGLGSDYTFKNRPIAKSKWRGDILRISPKGNIESIAHGLRYPTGLAIDDQDRLFCTDQQGVQNTFNELNCIQVGHRYGVPSRHESEPNAPADPPAVQIPHPWTRSVNGIVWISKSDVRGLAPLFGHFLGCEYNNNMLIRMSVQTAGGVAQGAVYPFSKPSKEGDPSNFVGPICIGISPHGEVYVGGFQDGGWGGGLNMGDIVKLTASGDLPNGIREIRATPQGFDLQFFHAVDPNLAVQATHYKVSGYTRVWKGDYATPDSGHHIGEVTSAVLGNDGQTVALKVAGRKTGHVYDIAVGEIGSESQRALWPAIGHYTLHRIPDQE